ncbi:MAG: hypothetical protein BZY77_07465 [SAR202 cluster bacterium Io17-Chloro-G5]|nr:MAG: hypothetical protein BZY77_07465 [SAR202 cluster bacterium Io17-Chloro-G5]
MCGLVSSPETRSGANKDLVESVGGQIITFDDCFGDYDFVGVFEFPDNTTAASLVMTVASIGSITKAKITVLIPIAGGFAANQKAREMTYHVQGQ